MDSASAQAAILKLINDLPDGSNPYEAIRSFLWQQLVPAVSESLPNQLYALSAALGVCLALLLLSLGMRVFGRAFWIARVGTNGLWTPHWSISWSLFAVVLVACLEAQIWVTMSYFKRTQIMYSYLPLRIFPWIAAWNGGWTALWSLAVSYLTHRNAMGKLQITPSRALLVNSLLLLFPILYFAALLPFAIKSCLTYRSLLDIFASLDQQLQEGVATFDPSSFSLIALAPGLAGLNSLSSLMEILIWDVRRVFIVFTVSGVVIVLILVLVSFLHLRSLSQVIHETTSIMNTLESSASKESALLRSYTNLKWTSLSFVSICVCFTAVCLYTSIDTAPALTDLLVLQVDLLMPLYIFAIFGLPTAILLFVRSLDVLEPPTSTFTNSNGRFTTSVGVGGKSMNTSTGQPPNGFEMVTPKAVRRQLSNDELFKMGLGDAEEEPERKPRRGGPSARGATVDRDADGWFKELSSELDLQREGKGSFTSSATPRLELGEEGIEDGRSSAASRRDKRRSSLWLSSGEA